MTRTPACWSPPAHPPALAAGEAVREWPLEIWGARAVYPPAAAPGFQRAWQLGLLPPPPPLQPPVPLAGWSSWDRLRLALLLCFVVTGSMLLLGNTLDAGGWTVLLSGVPFVSGIGVALTTSARDRLELAAGYTSSAAHTGLWRLARNGTVLREPDRSVPPPGWYPSPYYPGILQRWDGPGWHPLPEDWWDHEHQYFKAPPVPFL